MTPEQFNALVRACDGASLWDNIGAGVEFAFGLLVGVAIMAGAAVIWRYFAE